jgi:hypothetical protein
MLTEERMMRLIKLLHKWLSVVVALQLLIWLSSGLFFNLMDHSKAKGNANKIKVTQPTLIDHVRLLPPSGILSKLEFTGDKQIKPRQINSLKLIQLLNQPYYLLNHKQGLYTHFYNEHSLINAYNGEIKVIDDVMAKALAKTTYNGSGDVISVLKRLPPLDDMLKEENSTWQVNFNDAENTSVYIDASSGRIVGHSNDDKRFADFFFKLHFMDYGMMGKMGGFNNGLIIFFSLITLLFFLSGAVWVIELLKKGRYK